MSSPEDGLLSRRSVAEAEHISRSVDMILISGPCRSAKNLHSISAVYQYPKAGAGTHCIGYCGYMRGAITG